MEAAAEVFAERGFEGATTAEIAQRAGVAEGTIFKRFRTKRDLLLAVVGPHLMEIGAGRLRPIMQETLGGPAGAEAFLLAPARGPPGVARPPPPRHPIPGPGAPL